MAILQKKKKVRMNGWGIGYENCARAYCTYTGDIVKCITGHG